MKKLWCARYSAFWLGGYATVLAETEQEARNLLEPLMRENYWDGKEYDLEELDTANPHVIFSGDY